MYSVNFIFKNSSVSLAFYFKAHKNADELLRKGLQFIGQPNAAGRHLEATDDFDCKARIDMNEISSVVINDMQKEFSKQGEIALIQAREQAKTQAKARSDASLNPGIIQPQMIVPANPQQIVPNA